MKKIIAIWLALTGICLADGMKGYRHPVTYEHQYAVDSARAYFIYGADSDLVSLLPVTGTSHKFLRALNPTIDSVGAHFVRIQVYSGGSIIDSFYSVYMNLPDTSTLQGTTTAVGQIIDSLNALGVTFGRGTEPETLIVLSTADSTAIQNATVVLRTLNQTTIKVDGLGTNVNGKLFLYLDVASYFAALTANNYTQFLDTVVVTSGGGTDTLWMTPFSPGSPSAGGTGRLYSWEYDINGNPDSGIVVSAEIPVKFKKVRYGNVDISRFSRSDTTDANGYWSLDLYQYDSLTVNGVADTTVYYLIKGTKEASGDLPGGEVFSIQYKMPATTPVQMTPGSVYDVSD